MYGDARKYFSERVGILPEISLWYLENEFDKIALAVNNSEITVADLKKLLTEPPEVSNFALPDAIDSRKVKLAVQILRTQTRDKSKIPILTITLANHVRKIFSVERNQGRRTREKFRNASVHCKKIFRDRRNLPDKTFGKNFYLSRRRGL